MQFQPSKKMILFLILGLIPQLVLAQSINSSAQTLRQLIDQKNAELQKIQAEREAVERNLDVINKSSDSLKKEIKVMDSNINQLNLFIRSNKLTLEKLDLEIDSLQNDKEGIEEDIQNKKETIVRLLVELQKKDRQNLLITILKNRSLAESVAEAQTINKLNGTLSSNVQELRDFHVQLNQKLDVEQVKKRNREIEQTNLANRQFIIQDQKEEKQKLLNETKSQEKIYRDQINELDKKQETIGDEIGKIEDELRRTFDPSLLPIKRSGVLRYPVENARLTQEYGNTKFAARAYRTKFHNGVDFEARIGTPVFAAGRGKVLAVGNNGRLQYGKYVLIEHENNLTTLYAHFSRSIVNKGDLVEESSVIGYSGNTGYATGPHVHLTVYWAPSVTLKNFPGAGLVPVGITINPLDYL